MLYDQVALFQIRKAATTLLGASIIVLLTACGGGDYDGYGQMGAERFEGSQGDFLYVNEEGRAIYSADCAGCHGSSGEGSPSGPSLIACPSCSSQSALELKISQTMPTEKPGECVGECATNTAEYILGVFNGIALLTSQQALTGVDLLTPEQTLRKATLNLAGRLPSPAEVSTITAGGEDALDGVLMAVMSEDVFYERLKEIYNDVLLQDKYLGSENALSLIRDDDYPERRWYRNLGLLEKIDQGDGTEINGPNYDSDLYYKLRRYTNDAVGREVLELIDYVARSGRPFSEILTADYTMVNAYSARAYGVEGQASFRDMDEIEYPLYPEDPTDFQPARITDIPHAGLLTSVMFLNRFPTTNTNRNRHRARMVYDIFLDVDILALEGSRPGESLNVVGTTPTLDNPQCTGCHVVMDPVASIFQNWDYLGRYRPSSENDNWYTDILARGFNGVSMPLSGNTNSSLQWLGQEISRDPRFAVATVKTIYKGISGQDPLIRPVTTDTSSAQWQAYLAQQVTFNQISHEFRESNQNVKVAFLGVIKSLYWRATALAPGSNADIHNNMGSARLLTPEMLDRKIGAVLGYDWVYSSASYHWLTAARSDSYRQLYGGIDSNNVINRIEAPNGLMIAVQDRMAAEMACKVVARDFFKPASNRLLFPYVSIDTTDEAAVRSNIQHLFWNFYGEDFATSGTEINEIYQLFTAVRSMGLQSIVVDDSWENNRLSWNCQLRNDPETGESLDSNDRIELDEDYVLRSWQAVLNVMLSDYQFLYE
ncbi:MAG: DUF1588 domain-containing protein [Gammaproteobacteria bacterium]|nr:DUF1588 domain-containing protein [Gammaproteobacteria bacterium]